MADTLQARESDDISSVAWCRESDIRYFARRMAQRLGLSGYARNLPDGRVEVYAVGSASKLAEFRAELERGPQGASVTGVAEEEAASNSEFAKGFLIEY